MRFEVRQRQLYVDTGPVRLGSHGVRIRFGGTTAAPTIDRAFGLGTVAVNRGTAPHAGAPPRPPHAPLPRRRPPPWIRRDRCRAGAAARFFGGCRSSAGVPGTPGDVVSPTEGRRVGSASATTAHRRCNDGHG